MDGNLSYFKQVLTFVHQSREMADSGQDKLAQRIQELRTQAELDNLRNSSNMETSTSSDNFHGVGMSSYKEIEALMQSTVNGKQGYLLKRSSSLGGDSKRRLFVLDSHRTLYYRTNWSKNPAAHSHQSSGMSEHGGVFGRFKFTQHWVSSQDEENLCRRTVYLQTSIIKMDAEQSDLCFCFRIISPLKTYTLQAENGVDLKEWVDKIRGVTASLLNFPFHEQVRSLTLDVRVWEPTILDRFHALGNFFCNSVWEEVRQIQDVSGVSAIGVKKPTPKDNISIKEMYIQFKYVEKMLIVKPPSHLNLLWRLQFGKLWRAVTLRVHTSSL